MGTYAGGARVAGVEGDVDYALSASGLHTDGFPTAVGGARNVGSDSAGVSAKLIWSPLDNLHITGVARYSYTDADTNDQGQDPSQPKTFGLTFDSPGAHYINDAFYGLVRAQLDSFDGHWTNAVSAQIADTQRTEFDVANTGRSVRRPADRQDRRGPRHALPGILRERLPLRRQGLEADGDARRRRGAERLTHDRLALRRLPG